MTFPCVDKGSSWCFDDAKGLHVSLLLIFYLCLKLLIIHYEARKNNNLLKFILLNLIITFLYIPHLSFIFLYSYIIISFSSFHRDIINNKILINIIFKTIKQIKLSRDRHKQTTETQHMLNINRDKWESSFS